MRYSRLMIGVFLVAGLLNGAFAEKKEIKDTQKQLQKILDDTRNKYHFSAMALTVIAPKVTKEPMNFYSGTTAKKDGRALRPDDYFQIGSNSKSFLAALILKLQSENKLSVDDSITKWLPEYPQWKKVAIHNLLQNNSGIQSYTKSEDFLKVFDKSPDREFTLPELVSWSSKMPLLFEPGNGWDYSNTNWILAGMIAEKVGGSSLKNQYNDYFFTKLNLSNTKYWPTKYDKDILEHMVHGYTNEGQDTTYRNMSWGGPAGAIIANTEDLAKWAYALFHGQAVNASELEIMQSLVSTNSGKNDNTIKKSGGYAMGIGLSVSKAGNYWGHEGHTDGFHSIFSWNKDLDVTIAMQANGLKDADFHVVVQEIMLVLKSAESKA